MTNITSQTPLSKTQPTNQPNPSLYPTQPNDAMLLIKYIIVHHKQVYIKMYIYLFLPTFWCVGEYLYV
jgi:hypothetical protein